MSKRLEALINEYSRLITGAVRRVCRNRSMLIGEDVEQEVRVALWQHLKKGHEIRHSRAYIYKVALTKGLAMVERAERQSKTEADAAGLLPSCAADAANVVEQSEQLYAALDILAPRQQTAVRAYLTGFNVSEISKMFGWSLAVSRHAVYRGIDQIKRHVEQIPDANKQ